jgi:hypothetical protein
MKTKFVLALLLWMMVESPNSIVLRERNIKLANVLKTKYRWASPRWSPTENSSRE